MTNIPRRAFIRAKDLRKLPDTEDMKLCALEPELIIGDIVRLNSGGPPMQVVDTLLFNLETGEIIPDTITVAYRLKHLRGCEGKIMEWDIKPACVHRVRDAW